MKKINKQIKVSIVTVCYNSEKTILDTLNSMINQTYKNIEYIIIDGASKDSTLTIIKEMEDQIIKNTTKFTLISEKDQGLWDAMDKGISMATGDIVGMINSDDWYENIALEKVVEAYNSQNFDMFYSDLRIIKGKKVFVKKAKIKKILSSRHWNHPTTFLKREIYKSFKYDKRQCPDLELLLLMRKNNKKVEVLNEILANFRYGGVSTNLSFEQYITNLKRRLKAYKITKTGTILNYLDGILVETIKFVYSKI
ncbi:MAG: glycosyltransferase family 2 protein [Fusobacteriaceae bacterium]